MLFLAKRELVVAFVVPVSPGEEMPLSEL